MCKSSPHGSEQRAYESDPRFVKRVKQSFRLVEMQDLASVNLTENQ